jgi:hypothetical protein
LAAGSFPPGAAQKPEPRGTFASVPAPGPVVCESMFGNTQMIAEAVAGGLAHRMRVDAVEVGGAPAESFYLEGTLGPLLEGEQDRAMRWDDQLGAASRELAGGIQPASYDPSNLFRSQWIPYTKSATFTPWR